MASTVDVGAGPAGQNNQPRMKMSKEAEGYLVTALIAFAVLIVFNKVKSKLPAFLQ